MAQVQANPVDGACLHIEYLVMGPIENNVYLIDAGHKVREETADGLEQDAVNMVGGPVIVVDPTCEAPRIIEAVGERAVAAIVLTHRHHDHVGAARALREATGAPVVASVDDAPIICGDEPVPGGGTPFEPCPVDVAVEHGSVVELAGLPWKVIGTPGHTPGSMCLFIDPRFCSNPQGAPALIAGDTLFAGATGRTDFPGGSDADMARSIKRLAALPDETIVLPGHGPQTTIGAERQRVFAYFARWQ